MLACSFLHALLALQPMAGLRLMVHDKGLTGTGMSASEQNIAPGLWVVATPIGNLADLSARAQQVLAGVSLIAAEDTRVSRHLLSHISCNTPLRALHEHNENKVLPELLQRLREGEALALISDAGTPLISDPGYRLVRAAQEHGLVVYPVPGPCALVAALSVAGLPTDRFHFEGFLPAKAAARRTRLQALADYPHTLVVYESSHRLVATLQDLSVVMGANRDVCLCRELTKRFETVRRAPVAELAAWVGADSDQQKGEMVLVIAGAEIAQAEVVSAAARQLFRTLREHLPPSKAARIAADTFQCSRKALYREVESE